MQGNRTTVVISRHWHSPEIAVSVTDKSIGIEVSLEDFVTAMCSEMSHPLLSVTKNRLSADLIGAARATVEKLKEASASAA